jgi:hypothetical protein
MCNLPKSYILAEKNSLQEIFSPAEYEEIRRENGGANINYIPFLPQDQGTSYALGVSSLSE